MPEKWTPQTWRDLPIRQVPGYADKNALNTVEETLRRFPPLVFAGEARRLKDRLADVAAGKAFLPQMRDADRHVDAEDAVALPIAAARHHARRRRLGRACWIFRGGALP